MPATQQLRAALIAVERKVIEAEERCESQRSVVASLAPATLARAYAEHVLRVVERTLAISRGHQVMIQHLESDLFEQAA